MLRLKEAKLMVNLGKSEFRYAYIVFLSHKGGQEQVPPVNAKIEVVTIFPISCNKRELKCLLGMTESFAKTLVGSSTTNWPT